MSSDLLMPPFPWMLRWLVALALTPALFAQPSREREEPVLRGLTNFHHTEWGGLGAVFDIKQSPEGYLWLTTSKGVLRFDGVRFQSLEEITRGAVFDGDIDSIFLASSGGLWLTTQGAGLLSWKDGKLTAFPDRRCTPSRKQGQVIEDRNGSLWVQATAGLFRLRGSVCEQIGSEQDYPGGFPVAILFDREGTMWVKAQTGPLLTLRRGESRFQKTPYGEGVSTGFSFAFLHEAPDGTIWLSDSQGLRRVTSKPGAPASLSPQRDSKRNAPFGDFSFAADGSLWAVTQNGVRRFDHPEPWPSPDALETAPGENFTPSQGLSSDAVWKVLTDLEGVWIGTNSGLDRLRKTNLTAVRLPHTQEHEFSIAAGDGGSVWTGNSSLPLTHIAADGTVTSVPGTRQIIALRRDHTGTIWSAGAGDFHLWRSSGDRFLPLHYPNEELDSVLFEAADRNHDPWITTASGRAYNLTAGSWIKVVRWDGSEYQRYSFPDGQRGVSENTMSVRGDRVWLGGAGGVQLFSKGRFDILRWRDPSLPGRVSGLVETESGDLWINGFSGITHVSAAELNRWLQYPQYAVDPAAFERNRNRVPPPVIISAVTSDGHTHSASGGLSLPARTDNLEIEYTALSLSIPERVLFRYKLNGVDEDWQNVGTRRQAYYTKLRPGNYQFHVAARTRIARDLHDTLLQNFQGVLLKFHAVAYALPDRPAHAQRTLNSAIEDARQAIAEGRNAVQGLRSSTLVTNDLARAIDTFGEGLAADQDGGSCSDFHVHVEGTPRELAPILRNEVYQIAVGGKLAIWSQPDSGTEIELVVSAAIAYIKGQAARLEKSAEQSAG